MKVLLTIPLNERQIQALEGLGYEILFENENRSDFSGDYSDIEVVITYNGLAKIDRHKLPQLRWIQLTSIGFDQVPKSYHGDLITNNQGGYSPQIGEWVVGMMLALEKKLHQIYDNQKAKHWDMLMNLGGLASKTVLFIGTGSLAKESVKRLSGFGLTIIGLNQTGHLVEGFDACYPLSEAKAHLGNADHVVICLPSTKETIGLVDEAFILALKEGAHLINISRGAIIKEADLIKQHAHLGMVALDVFEVEPLPQTSPLWTLPNVIISSHNSWVNQTIQQHRFELFQENLSRFAKGETLKNIIMVARGY